MDEEKRDQVEPMEIASASSDSLIDDLDDEEEEQEEEEDEVVDKEELQREEPLTEQEIEELIEELLEVENKAAEAQEALEDESLGKVEAEVMEELSQSLNGDELEKAVAEEIATLKEEWERTLDELETESSHLLEQLDGAGIELPSLYKWIESQTPNGCRTEAWKKRAHWVGSQETANANEYVSEAEKYLQIHRPVRRKHGKVLEEGASGFLQKKLGDGHDAVQEKSNVDWNSFSKICSDSSSLENIKFGSKQWAAVYLASTPHQAAELGLKFPGVDEVEEIDDIEESSSDPFIADAIANEKDLDLSEEQRKKFRKVKEEDDAIVDQKLQMRLKRRRRRTWDKGQSQAPRVSVNTRCLANNVEATEKEVSSVDMLKECSSNGFYGNSKVDAASEDLKANAFEYPSNVGREEPNCNGHSGVVTGSSPSDLTEKKVAKSPNDFDELDIENKKCQTITIDSVDEVIVTGDKTNLPCNADNTIRVKLSDGNYHCTACGNLATDVHRHPLIKVIVCLACKISLEAKMLAKDIDYCAWCAGSSDLISCRSCKTLFCAVCIRKNLGEAFFMEVQSSGWQCCCCSPSLLQQLSSELDLACESEAVSSSDSDSDDSDVGLDVKISTKRKRKKKIRRILDDAELGEETRRKIAIEKERQERLKSLGAQLSYKSMVSSNVRLYEGDNVEVLGDISTGYIVNVVREEGEEAVRIPPSISSKLKPHQIAGVRFMWENIVQSIRRVRSGDKGLGCILAHTMGLGKTFQVIAFLYTAMRSVDLGLRTALIVTPVSVLHNWRQEFIKWRPSEFKPLRVFMLEDVPRERRAELLMKWRTKGGIFLIGYSAFRNLSLGKHAKDRHVAREITVALQEGPDILICDEAHIIKNTSAEVTQALKQVKCQRRIALTGSPLQNNLMEYYCMVDFVREGFLGSSREFRNRFQNPIENGQHTNSTAEDVKIMNQRSHILYEQLKGFVQRVDMNVVKKDLPPKTVFVVAVKLSPLQRKLYKRFLDVHGFTSDKISGEKIRKGSFWTGYQSLAQIWNHPGVLQLMKDNRESGKREDPLEADDSSSDENVDYNMIPGEKTRNNNVYPQRKNDNTFLLEDWWSDLLQGNKCRDVDHSGKMVLLLDILTMCCNMGEKALVFSQSLSTLDLIETYLSRLPRPGREGKFWKKGKDWYRLDGRTESSERQKLVERFNERSNRRVKCTLISTKAGSLGINLYAANRVVIVDGSWNPTYDLQAIYRVWRYGQTKPVFAYRLLAHGTMEEKIYKRQVTKEGLAARVVDRQQVHRTISKEEMLHLFDLGDDENPDSGLGQGNGHVESHVGLQDKSSLPHGSTSSDKLLQSLIGLHHPRWIANYHEHESLLQENEDEKLSKEEQDMAWEVYRKTLEWEEVQRVSPDESAFERQRKLADKSISDRKPELTSSAPSTPGAIELSRPLGRARDRVVPRKCTNLSHLLTLRSQGTKIGCSTICGECAQEISWENLHKDGRSVR